MRLFSAQLLIVQLLLNSHKLSLFFISTILIIMVGYPTYNHLDRLISLTFNIGVEGPGSIRHGLVGIHSHRLLRLQLSGLEHHGKISPLS